MQVTFTSNYGADLGLTMTGRIIIKNVELTRDDISDILRYISDVAHTSNFYSDVLEHELHIEVAQHVTFTAITEAVELIKDHIAELEVVDPTTYKSLVDFI
jgi:hypothetical protein